MAGILNVKHFRVAAVVTDFGFIHCWRRNYHHDAALVRSVPGPQPPRSGAYPQRDEGSRRNGFTAQVTNQSPSIIIISFVFFFLRITTFVVELQLQSTRRAALLRSNHVRNIAVLRSNTRHVAEYHQRYHRQRNFTIYSV